MTADVGKQMVIEGVKGVMVVLIENDWLALIGRKGATGVDPLADALGCRHLVAMEQEEVGGGRYLPDAIFQFRPHPGAAPSGQIRLRTGSSDPGVNAVPRYARLEASV